MTKKNFFKTHLYAVYKRTNSNVRTQKLKVKEWEKYFMQMETKRMK